MARQTGDRTEAASIGRHAEENLRFIRLAMERSSTFTAVSGVAGIGMGTIAVVAAIVAARQPSPERWLAVWFSAAVAALFTGVAAMWRKAARSGAPLTGAVGRRFALGMAAPLIAGAALTYVLWRAGAYAAIVPTWLLLYGVGVVVGGLFSVPVVRALGVCLMAAGLAAIVTPASWGDAWLAIGFGVLQIGFGIHIARHYGG